MDDSPKTDSPQQQERHATWLELFYDLIFVIAIGQLTTFFSNDLTLVSLWQFVLLFIPIWWAWTGHTMYANRFELDDQGHRILTLTQVLGSLFMAVFIQEALLKESYLFACAYLFIRLVLLTMYLRVFYREPDSRKIVTPLLIGFSIGATIWLVSVFTPPPGRFYLWVISWLLEFTIPWLNHKRLRKVPIHNTHLPERFGLFVIIVLGESILRITRAVINLELWQFFTGANAICSFILIVLIWWIYFDYIEEFVTGKIKGTGLLYTYLHFFIYLGIVILGVGLEYSILSHISTLANVANLLMVIGITLFILPLGIIQGINFKQVPTRRFIISSLGLIVVMVTFYILEVNLKTFYFLPVLTLTIFIYLLFQRFQYSRLPDEI
ncbi:low temperature requirement protein A [Adhaeribacter arboris]|uniref:Low temperature requirement protein A n=1 Tax=Adhaeribacter arboris TaxID=2072846 RepID=A0A2T2YL57_9BACT|nr:low temperature requirement protein A [Adhaeribacter arboris]PSR56230.1 low temperature requirement protein A [Adhaeribacter arboris]